MRKILCLMSMLVMSMSATADDSIVDFDESIDFTQLTTFFIRPGQIVTRLAELQGPFVEREIAAAIRAELTARGLTERERAADADLVVNFRLGASEQQETQVFPGGGRRGRVGRRRETIEITQGTLQIELYQSVSREMIWRGVYRDDEGNAERLTEKLPRDVEKLFDEYPVED